MVTRYRMDQLLRIKESQVEDIKVKKRSLGNACSNPDIKLLGTNFKQQQ